MMTSEEALARLKRGHQRYLAGQGKRGDWPEHQRSPNFNQGQEPFAILPGCFDSRARCS